MKVSLLKIGVDYAVFALSVLLVFILVFESYLSLPLLVAWLGRFHPVVLHLPIVLILVAIVQYWRKDPHVQWYISITAILCLITSITGTFLSVADGAQGGLVNTHQWLGVAITALMVLWHYRSAFPDSVLKIFHPLLVIGILATGHLGGSITHGEDFLAFRSDDAIELEALPDDPELFAHFIQPILVRKCVSCHNPNKTKGQLLMTDYAALVEGGEGGSALATGTGILHRIGLPMDNEEHMPPKNEDQLTSEEKQVLAYWLEAGGQETFRYSEMDPASNAYQLVAERIEASQRNRWLDLPSVSDDEIEALSGDYSTLLRKYHQSNAVQALIFPHVAYEGKELQALADIKENIVELNLSNLPLTEEDLQLIASFENLELLDLHGAQLPESGLLALASLDQLSTLKIYGTTLGDNALAMVGDLEGLQQVYVYGTAITDEAIAKLRADRSSLTVFDTPPLAAEFRSALTVPELEPRNSFFRDPFHVKVDYPLSGIDIRYTTDGTDPNEQSPTLMDSLLIDHDMTVKLFAAKDGWEPSPKDSVAYMRSPILPKAMSLQYAASNAYEGEPEELFDLQKGTRQHADGPWMAFIDDPLVLTCELEAPTAIDEIIFSTLTRTGQYIFPPHRIRVWGGNSPSSLRSLGQMVPPKADDQTRPQLEYHKLALAAGPVTFLKIQIDPIPRLPYWHPAKGEPGWLFIDEIVLR